MAKLRFDKKKQTTTVRKSGLPKDYLPSKPTKADSGAADATPRSMTITPAENGYVTRHDPPPDKKGGYTPDVTNVHATTGDLTSFISNLFKGNADDQKSRRVNAAKAALRGPKS